MFDGPTMAFTDVRLKIELPAPETPPSDTQTKHTLHTLSPTNNGTDIDDDERGLQRINYPSIDAKSNTMHHLILPYGDEFCSNSSSSSSDIDTLSNISNIETDTHAPTMSADSADNHTLDASTANGLSSFPDLSYNDFDALSQRASESVSTHTAISTQRGTSFSTKQSILRFNASKFTTRGHANGMFKRRSHSAVLSISDTSSLRRQTTNISKTLDDPHQNHNKAPQAQVPSLVPIDRHNANHNHFLLQPTPRRLSLSLSSITSDASYSRRYSNYHHEHSYDIAHVPDLQLDSIHVPLRNISRISPYANTKHKIKIPHSIATPRTIETGTTTSNTLNTVLIHNTLHSQNITQNITQPQLTPLMDGFEAAYSANSGCTETDAATSDDLDYDDEDEEDEEDEEEEVEDEDEDDASSIVTMTTCTTNTTCNDHELEQSIDEFFSVIDSAGIGSVTFDILKICLKLLGVDLSALQLDILLNELTHYKPSLPISRHMMHEFILCKNKKTKSHQTTIIRTEIIVGLLSNLDTTKQTPFVHTTNYNRKKKTKQQSSFFMPQANRSRPEIFKKKQSRERDRKPRIMARKSKSHPSKSKSKSRRSSHNIHDKSAKNIKNKSHKNEIAPYIITKARRSTRNIHGRFHSDGNIMKPTLHDLDSQSQLEPHSHSQPESQTQEVQANKTTPNPHRKPPQIRRHATKQSKKSSLSQLSPSSLTNLPPLPPTPLKHKKYNIPPFNICEDGQLHKTAAGEYDEWLLICFRNSIIDSLMELLLNDELRVYVFDDHMIAHHILGNDVLSAIEYLFECQFAFMSNGSAYLDFNAFASGMNKSNIHFENASIAIPLIFEQLVALSMNTTKKKKKKKKVDYSNSFIAQDTFVEWMMNHIRVQLAHQNINPFDARIDTLFNIVQSFYNQMQCKYNQYVVQQQQQRQKRKQTMLSNVSMKSKQKQKKRKSKIHACESNVGMISSLGVPPRQRLNEFHLYSSNNKYHLNMPSAAAIHHHNDNNNHLHHHSVQTTNQLYHPYSHKYKHIKPYSHVTITSNGFYNNTDY